ncbi:MAG: histidine kinase N-terminal 7TM domain-containing protein [Syntrophomonas sp.]
MVNALNFALSLSGIMYFLLIWFSWRRRTHPGAKSFAYLMLAYGIYSLGYYFELHSSNLQELTFWLKFEYLGVAFIPALWMLFCIQYTESKRLNNPKLITTLFVLSCISLLVVYTNSYHQLFHLPIAINMKSGLAIAVLKHGPWCWVHMAYLSLAEIGGSILLLNKWRHTSRNESRPAGAMFIGSLIPWVCLILFLTGNTPLHLDLCPVAFIFTGLIYIWVLFHYHIFDIVPVARSTVFEKMGDAVMVLDAECRIIDYNSAVVELFDNKPVQNGQKVDDYFKNLPVLARAINTMDSGNNELCLEKNDQLQWLQLHISRLPDEHGKMGGRVVIIRNISARKRDEARLEEINHELLKWVGELNQHISQIRTLNKMIALLQATEHLKQSHRILSEHMPQVFPGVAGGFYIRREASNLMDLAASWNLYRPIKWLVSMQECFALQRQAFYLLRAGQDKLSCEHVDRNDDYDYLCVPVMVQDEIIGLLHFFAPGTELDEQRLTTDRAASDSIALALANIKMREMLLEQSIHDPLTGLYNRRYMEETLRREMLRAERNSAVLTVIMVDVDHFKRFNDSYGHPIGDLVLQKVSRVIENSIRGEDIACRYGGEEFVLIMPGTGLDVAQQRAQALRERIKAQYLAINDNAPETITISLGIAVYPEHGRHLEALLKSADHALYQAKQAGRDRVMAAAPL